MTDYCYSKQKLRIYYSCLLPGILKGFQDRRIQEQSNVLKSKENTISYSFKLKCFTYVNGCKIHKTSTFLQPWFKTQSIGWTGIKITVKNIQPRILYVISPSFKDTRRIYINLWLAIKLHKRRQYVINNRKC